VRGLHLDSDGTLWIGTNHGGIHRLKDGRLETPRLEGAALTDEVRWFWRDERQTLWIGTYDGLLDASNLVQVVERRQGFSIASLEEISYRHGWIDKPMLLELARKLVQTPYAEYLKRVADD
jgi:glucose-1-phosphate thymidylyltransferase